MPDLIHTVWVMAAVFAIPLVAVVGLCRSQRFVDGIGESNLTLAAVVFGAIVGCWLLPITVRFPPASALDRLLTMILPAVVVVEILASLRPVSNHVAMSFRAVLVLASGWLLLRGSVYLSSVESAWSVGQAFGVLCLLALVLGTVWLSQIRLHERTLSHAVPISIALAIGCGALLMPLSGFIKGGMVGLTLATAMSGTCLGCWLAKGKRSAKGLIGWGVVMLHGVLVVGRFFGRVTTEQVAVAMFAPLAAWIPECLPARYRSSRWVIGVAQVLLVCAPLVIVLVVAKRDFDRKMGPLLK